MPSRHRVMPPYSLWVVLRVARREPGLLLLPVFPGSRGETQSSAVGQTPSSSSWAGPAGPRAAAWRRVPGFALFDTSALWKNSQSCFLSLLSSMRAEEAAGFRPSAINKNEANESDFQKEKILLLSRETHDSGPDTAFAVDCLFSI